jgi:hypothetical protein
MKDNLTQFLAKHQLLIQARLGFGIHGSVYSVVEGDRTNPSAVKVFNEREHFLREFEVYERLDQFSVKQICGFNVPEMLRADEELLAIQMTIVTRPFVLDFAGAYVDARPKFSEEIWAEWEAQKKDQYGDRWPLVCQVLDSLAEMDIYMIDVSPTNIAFID